ncbi:hypothetical protein [Candidatus Mycobacterium methanotrophicum]|uniref:SAM-dependent methyltransferase n=1 Tax=Candidatus Mycobacterium methanotrophicum TaxID=2943498 RepID=A0ABY4QS85_9MYCO|nr:hypothetical protein [Candidatus Mycobacterium methanotrophicum]UQX12801.1 hypothetical protein M5I08_12025 [Candidatus Mycobacterium methanotrophicum]
MDGDYRSIPAPVVFVGYVLLCVAAAVVAGLRLTTGRALPRLAAAALGVSLIAAGLSIWRLSRRAKFEVWARLLTGIGLRGDERMLDLGCGRGALLLTAAKLLPRGNPLQDNFAAMEFLERCDLSPEDKERCA